MPLSQRTKKKAATAATFVLSFVLVTCTLTTMADNINIGFEQYRKAFETDDDEAPYPDDDVLATAAFWWTAVKWKHKQGGKCRPF